MRRIRIHQSWYRHAILGLSAYGTLAGSNQPCGSVLTDSAADRFMNFHSNDAISRYRSRRLQGWGVDPIRCTKYLTSSQTLSFNMLAPVLERPARCAELFNTLLSTSDLTTLESSDFEFSAAGTAYSLGDRTLLDLVLRFRTSDGGIQVVAVETKLADRFSTRRTVGMHGEAYRQVAVSRGLWQDLDDALADNRTRQLTRCHALAESVQQHDDCSGAKRAKLLVLKHNQDSSGEVSVTRYQRKVSHQGSVVRRTWDEYLAAAEVSGALDLNSVQSLVRRYVDLTPSEESFQATQSTRECGPPNRRDTTWR